MTNSLQSKLDDLQKAVQKQEIVFNFKHDVYADFVDNSLLPVIWTKEDGSIIYSNKAMDELIGCQVYGKTSCHYMNKDEHNKIHHRLKSGRVNGLNVTLQKCNGQTIHCQAYINVCRGENDICIRYTFVPNSLPMEFECH